MTESPDLLRPNPMAFDDWGHGPGEVRGDGSDQGGPGRTARVSTIEEQGQQLYHDRNC